MFARHLSYLHFSRKLLSGTTVPNNRPFLVLLSVRVLFAVTFIGALSATAQGQLTVSSSATGGFRSSKGCFSGMVPAFTFKSAGKVLITGGGSINLAGTVVPPSGVSFSPALDPFRPEQDISLAAVANGVLSGTQHVGGLLGAFVTELLVSTPGFQPISDTISPTGISAASLFFIGGGRFEFKARVPGTLYLGLNSTAGCGDSGSFSIVVEIPVRATVFPASLANSIRQSIASAIPIAILGSESFDPRRIDPRSLVLVAPQLSFVGTSKKTHCQEKDVDGDGFVDLICEFQVAPREALRSGIVISVLQGKTIDGVGVRAEVPLNIIPGPSSQGPIGLTGSVGLPR